MAGEKGATFASQLLQLIFNGTPIANIADNAASSPRGNLVVALHSADPGASGNQGTNEVSYGSYARVNVARTSGGWTVTSDSVSPVAPITFPTCTSGSVTATHFSVGQQVGGSPPNEIFYAGPITPNIVISTGVAPQLTTLTACTEA